MSHLLYLMFRCDFDVMENLEEWEGTKHRPRHTHAEIDVRRPRAFARLILAETDAYRPATMGGYGVPGSIITIASWLLHFGIDVTGRPAGARIECRCRPRCCSGRPPRRRPCDALFVHKAGAHRHNQSTGTTLRACLCAVLAWRPTTWCYMCGLHICVMAMKRESSVD